jgi:hypothetical protein
MWIVEGAVVSDLALHLHVTTRAYQTIRCNDEMDIELTVSMALARRRRFKTIFGGS